MLWIALFFTVYVILIAAWHWWFLHSNRCRALRVLRWLEGAIDAHGHISGVEWMTPAHFRARLELPGCPFRHPSLDVHMAPRHTPLKWAMWRWRGRRKR